MKKIKLFIYNYGSTELADFRNNQHVAIETLNALNDSIIKTHGDLPNKIFYYLAYTSTGLKGRYEMIRYTGADLLQCNFAAQHEVLKKEKAAKISAAFIPTI